MPNPTPLSNAEKMANWAERCYSHAKGLTPSSAHTFFLSKAEWINEQINAVSGDRLPSHLVGLNIFDLANLRDELAAEALKAGAFA